MKKITFILLALISGTAFAQSGASATAPAFAEIVSPIEISSDGTLSFGRIAQTSTGGTVTVATNGTISYTGDGSMIISGNVGTNPVFTVTAQDAYQITVPESLTITNGTSTMTLDNFKTGLTSNSGATAENFALGATLTISGGQEVGTYTGDVPVTVSYE